MQTTSAPSPVRGLAVALLLGVVLATVAVGFLANVPVSVELTGASQSLPSTNESKITQGGGASTSVPASSNTTSGSAAPSVANSTSPSFVSVNDIASAISGGQVTGASNSSFSGSASGNASNTALTLSQTKATTVATAWRDLAIFAAAGALALGAFLVSRRQMS